MLFWIQTTTVPAATSIVSPSAALLIAPLIVAHGAPVVEQELLSLPVVATYKVLPRFAACKLDVSNVDASELGCGTSFIEVGTMAPSDDSVGNGVSVCCCGSGVD